MASANAGLLAAVSDRALIIPAAFEASLAHDGINPHFIKDNSRKDCVGFRRTVRTG